MSEAAAPLRRCNKILQMAHTVAVQVVGFSDVERHSLNTLFRLSERQSAAYTLWSPEMPSPPKVALIDLESYEGGLEVASPGFNPNIKLLCVGRNPPEQSWRSFQRPVDWTALVAVLDDLFASPADVDIDIATGEMGERVKPPGVKMSLLVGLKRADRLYLRARLALAGMTDVDEVDTAAEAGAMLSQRRYEVVVLSLELIDADPWALAKTLKTMPTPVRSVIVCTDAPSWRAMEFAESIGCAGLLEIPFEPSQVMAVLKKV